MSRRGIAIVRAHLAKLPPPESLTIAERRDQYERAEQVFPVAPDVAVETIDAAGVAAEWLAPTGARANAALLYLHGGGYVIGSPRSHRHVAAALGCAAGTSVLLPEYRLAPEHRFPAAVDDAVTAYRWLLARGIDPARIVIAGDSAGGGLTIALLVALRDAAVRLPAAAVCISPWVDMTCAGKSYDTLAAADPIVQKARVLEMADLYLASADATHPLASPVFADLTGLPPLFVQVGSDEVLLDDAVALVDRARAAGVVATLEVWPEMIHVWHWFLSFLDEAPAAIDAIGAFVRGHITAE